MSCPWLINTLWRTENDTATMEPLSYTKAFIQKDLSVSLNFIQCPEQLLDKLAERNFLSVITEIKTNSFLASFN